MEEHHFYVYELVDPNTNQPFYVGKGSGDRINVYSREYPKVNEFTKTRLEEIALSGKQLEIRYVSQSLSEKEALELEASLIAKYGRIAKDPGGILTNIRSSDYARTGTPSNRNTYTTIQIRKEINKHIKDFCAANGLIAAGVTEKLWLKLISGSISLQ